jgi:hypothetical protein
MTADIRIATIFSKDHGVRAFVDGERVGCPLRGVDVDVEECLGCDKLLRLVDDDRPYLVCDPWHGDAPLGGFDR